MRVCAASLSGRQLLRYTALVAATFPAVRLLQPEWALADQAGAGVAVPINLELVTVSDTRSAPSVAPSSSVLGMRRATS